MGSEKCVRLLVASFGGTSLTWKRVSKKGDGKGNIVRVFENRNDGQRHTVVEDQFGCLCVMGDTLTPTAHNVPDGGDKLFDLYAHAVTVNFNSCKPGRRGFSGRVIYDLSGLNDDAGEKGQVAFFCGFETSDGWLDDGGSNSSDVDDLLKVLFADISGAIEVGAAESFHMAGPIGGVAAKDLWTFIQHRLADSGAVKMKKH